MDAIQLLKDDHQKVSDLFEKAEGIEDDKQKLQIFQQIKDELELHSRIEENIFYPACAKFEELKDLVAESIEEHRQVKTLLREISALAKGSDKLEAKMTVLQEDVEHHVQEEEDELFPQVRKLMNKAELERLGNELVGAKGQKAGAKASRT